MAPLVMALSVRSSRSPSRQQRVVVVTAAEPDSVLDALPLRHRWCVYLGAVTAWPTCLRKMSMNQ